MPIIYCNRLNKNLFINNKINKIPINAIDLDNEFNNIQDYINNYLPQYCDNIIINSLNSNKIKNQILGIGKININIPNVGIVQPQQNYMYFSDASRFLSRNNTIPINILSSNFAHGILGVKNGSFNSYTVNENGFVAFHGAEYNIMSYINYNNVDLIIDNFSLTGAIIKDGTLNASHLAFKYHVAPEAMSIDNNQIMDNAITENKLIDTESFSIKKFGVFLDELNNPVETLPKAVFGSSCYENLTSDNFALNQIDRRNFIEYTGDGEFIDNKLRRIQSDILDANHLQMNFVDSIEWLCTDLDEINHCPKRLLSDDFSIGHADLPKFRMNATEPILLDFASLTKNKYEDIYFFGYHPLDFDDEVINLMKKKNCYYED